MFRDILTTAVILVITTLLGVNSQFENVLFKNSWWYYETCGDTDIVANISNLTRSLEENLFGQHIVHGHLISALEAHFNSKVESRKPLVISFHGTPGTGKNYVSDFVTNALYRSGLKSKFVKKYLGRAEFSQLLGKDKLQNEISQGVKKRICACPKSLFVFDEADKMPPGSFDTLTPLLNFNKYVDGCDVTQAIFIFLSNTGGVEISERLANLFQNGKLREETTLSDFELILRSKAYNLEGGLKGTSLIEASVIDHFLPFLPLEKAHLKKCVIAEFKRWGKTSQTYSDDIINRLIDDTVVFDSRYGLFSTAGCKGLDKKVAVAVSLDNKNFKAVDYKSEL